VAGPARQRGLNVAQFQSESERQYAQLARMSGVALDLRGEATGLAQV